MTHLESMPENPVAVVGGGLAGLTALAHLARAEVPAVLFEKSETLGGRARTDVIQGYAFNLGGHALYRGEARRILDALGVELRGGKPSPKGAFAVLDGKKHTLPSGLVSLLVTDLLPLSAKLEFARVGTLLMKKSTAANASPDESFRDWLDRSMVSESLRRLIMALLRVTTYTSRAEAISARLALSQLRSGLFDGVDYLDGGWQTITDGLEKVALESGGRIVRGARVERIEHDTAVRAIVVGGMRIPIRAAILAVPPRAAAALLSGPARSWTEAQGLKAVPATVACLDVALKRLPDPRARFALGIDRPTYYSLHSATARLAPEGGALVQLMKYGGDEAKDAARDRRELESLLDLMQPGWRAEVVHARFLPDMVAAHAILRPSTASPRPEGPVEGVSGLHLAGDWVGTEHHLADAALASARDAAARIQASSLGRAKEAA